MSLAEVKGTREKHRLADSKRGLQVFVRETIAAVIITNWFCRRQAGLKRQRLVRVCESFSHGDGFSGHQSPRLYDSCSIKSPLDRRCPVPAFNLTSAVLQSPFVRRT